MASYDQERSCLVVRIVFDGPALAGKTTNLKQLCELFPIEKRSEMYTPGSLKGRTMFFDWLEIDGGKKTQQSFRFQLLTVPGQVQRNYRRRPLIEMADVVVFVCDCNPDQLEETKRSFAQLRTHLKKRLPRKVPLVVQANKQDHPEALTPTEIREILKLDEWVQIISAVASAGDGVKETIAAAMRMAMKEAQAQMNEGALMHGSLGSSASTADDLFMAMLELEDAEEPEDEETAARAAFVAMDAEENSALSSLDMLDAPSIPPPPDDSSFSGTSSSHGSHGSHGSSGSHSSRASRRSSRPPSTGAEPPRTVAYEVAPLHADQPAGYGSPDHDEAPPRTVMGVGMAGHHDPLPNVAPIYYEEPTTRPAPPPDESTVGQYELDVDVHMDDPENEVHVEVDTQDEPTVPLPSSNRSAPYPPALPSSASSASPAPHAPSAPDAGATPDPHGADKLRKAPFADGPAEQARKRRPSNKG